MWTEIDWRCAHHNHDETNNHNPNDPNCPCTSEWECECNGRFCVHRQYEFLNGAHFGAKNIAGGVIFRDNEIWNAFNGIRVKAGSAPQDGEETLNFEVYRNAFHYIRDNPVEPEDTVLNWRVYHNRIRNAHAWFSLDGVS
jgi:hypothetical protein